MPDTPPLLRTDALLHADALQLLRGRVLLSGPEVPPADSSHPAFEFEAADVAIVGTRRHYDGAAFARAPR